ncbi:hypothetical protein [Nostoc sp.]|uniref:hypothetical protein n=1 Tax=Nostoc sp. TaxID=1180 RepID=UPI002FFC16C3
MICENGQTQETSRRLNSSDIFDQSERLGGLQASGAINGIEQIRLNQADCSTQDISGRANKRRVDPPGKIVERLKRIEDRHLSHLKAHQHLLESQLDHVKEEQQEFRKELQELEEEIYNLVSSEGKSQRPSEPEESE